ncbi:DUF3159 domain-containing protein [soil metagenome]
MTDAPRETAAPETPPAGDPVVSPQEVRRQQFIDSFGGVRGMIDSALPVVVFIAGNSVGGLDVGIWSAITAGIGIVILRLVQRTTLQQAFSGFLGIAIAALIARQTGEARGFFLLGIWGSLFYAGLFTLSALIRRPVTGLIWEYVSPSRSPWRRQPALLRVYTWTTMMWAVLYTGRFAVQGYLYDTEQTGWLAVARLAMGYPLTIVVLAVTVIAVRRVRHRLELELPAA